MQLFAEGHASADAVKAEAVRSSEPEVSRHPQLAPVEFLGDGSSSSQQLGSVDLSQYDSYRWLIRVWQTSQHASLCCRPATSPPSHQARLHDVSSDGSRLPACRAVLA